MIEINLIPEEFRIKEKVEKPQVPWLKIVIGAAVFGLLLTLIFYFDYRGAVSKAKQLDAQWAEVQPKAQILTQLQNEVELLKKDKAFMEKFVTAEQPLTHVMEWLSLYLPETAWLRQVRMEDSSDKHTLVIRGLTLPTKDTSSIEFIETYLHNLKLKMPDARLSLTTARQFQDDIEVTQFTAIFEWPDIGDEKK